MTPVPTRLALEATRHAVSAGHHLAAQAGFQIVEAGGNAIDAGVAAGMALGVLEPLQVSFAGVAPMAIYLAESRRVVTIAGLGVWPAAASCDYFLRNFGGDIPEGIARTVVPGGPDAWITAIEQFGTMSFADVASATLSFARDGFAIYPRLHEMISSSTEKLRRWPGNAAQFLPRGRVPEVSSVFRQPDFAATLQYMIDEERVAASRHGREAGLQAARDAFYRGDIAAKIVRYHEENGGLLRADDLANYRVKIENSATTRFRGIDIHTPGPWCQGPMLLQALNILEGFDLVGLGHNSPAYIHLVTEALKLAAADREAYYADPDFVDVPLAVLLSKDYAAARRKQISPKKAWPEMPPAGDVTRALQETAEQAACDRDLNEGASAHDTSYLCAVDRHGNVFSATPSDGTRVSPVIPGLGFAPSGRGSQSRTDPDHIASVLPGKRPRLTPSPAIAFKAGEFAMPFGTPGGDVQPQSMLQVFLNIHVFGMDPQAAVEAPRFASYSFPSWFAPYDYYPGQLSLEARIAQDTGAALAEQGHKIDWWGEHDPLAGSVCTILRNERTGVIHAAADPRRTAYAAVW